MHGLILLAQIPFVLRIPELLAEPWFKYLLLPVCGLLAGAVVKGLYRKDDREWAKEDFAWGNGAATPRITSFKPFQSESILFHLPIRWDDLRRLQ